MTNNIELLANMREMESSVETGNGSELEVHRIGTLKATKAVEGVA